jgi:hypothetical protein
MKLAFAFPLVALLTLARAALAQDVQHETGVPLSPGEAAGGWTLESSGQPICTVRLTARYGAASDGRCGDALPAAVAGWRPTSDGMALTDSSGQVVMPFSRWSNSLFVSKRTSGEDLQLMRGGPWPQDGE